MNDSRGFARCASTENDARREVQVILLREPKRSGKTNAASEFQMKIGQSSEGGKVGMS